MNNAITDPKQIEKYSIRVLIKAIELEMMGMKRNGKSAYAIAKQRFGLKGSRENVVRQLRQMV